MKIIEKLRKFFEGTFDYENPSAGCCKSASAIPEMQKEYKRIGNEKED